MAKKYNCYATLVFRCVTSMDANSSKEAKKKAEEKIEERLTKIFGGSRIYYLRIDHARMEE